MRTNAVRRHWIAKGRVHTATIERSVYGTGRFKGMPCYVASSDDMQHPEFIDWTQCVEPVVDRQ